MPDTTIPHIGGAEPGFCKKRGTVSPIFVLWPRECFFPYARFLYGLHYAFEECKPVPLSRLYILHFHRFYVHVVDPHLVMTNMKKAFQF